MAIQRRDDTCQDNVGAAIPGVMVYYLTQPANVPALTPLATVYSDTLGTVAANPQSSDGSGRVIAYLSSAGLYTVVYNFPNGTQVVYADQSVGASGGGGGTPVAEVPSGLINGTNTTFTLSHAPAANTLVLQYNGIVQTLGLGYTISGAVITLAVAPQTGDQLYANYSY